MNGSLLLFSMLSLATVATPGPTTRRALIVAGALVLGLRPGRLGLLRTTNWPNPESFTSLPAIRQVLISSKNASTISLASRRFSPR